jgi:hypothetical protein
MKIDSSLVTAVNLQQFNPAQHQNLPGGNRCGAL